MPHGLKTAVDLGQNRRSETSRKVLKSRLKAPVCPQPSGSYFLLGCVVTSSALGAEPSSCTATDVVCDWMFSNVIFSVEMLTL